MLSETWCVCSSRDIRPSLTMHPHLQEVASKLISATINRDPDTGKPINSLDAHFKSLRLTSMDPVARKTGEFSALESYVRETHGSTHHMRVEVLNAFRVERAEETEAWVQAGNNNVPAHERFLLWHGSRTTNFAGILKQGLRIAPPEAPVTGQQCSIMHGDP